MSFLMTYNMAYDIWQTQKMRIFEVRQKIEAGKIQRMGYTLFFDTVDPFLSIMTTLFVSRRMDPPSSLTDIKTGKLTPLWTLSEIFRGSGANSGVDKVKVVILILERIVGNNCEIWPEPTLLFIRLVDHLWLFTIVWGAGIIILAPSLIWWGVNFPPLSSLWSNSILVLGRLATVLRIDPGPLCR